MDSMDVFSVQRNSTTAMKTKKWIIHSDQLTASANTHVHTYTHVHNVTLQTSDSQHTQNNTAHSTSDSYA